MRDLTLPPVSRFRVTDNVNIMLRWGDSGGRDDGAFAIPQGVTVDGYRAKTGLRVIASGGEGGMGWDHLSVSCRTRVPEWGEMMLVQRLFFEPHEVVVQFGLPKSKHVNVHPFVLHWWRPRAVMLPLPPEFMV
jgi:hypothetical protein